MNIERSDYHLLYFEIKWIKQTMVSFLFVYAFLWTAKKSPEIYQNSTKTLHLSTFLWGEIKKLNYHNIQVWKYVPEADRQISRFFAHIYMLVDL